MFKGGIPQAANGKATAKQFMTAIVYVKADCAGHRASTEGPEALYDLAGHVVNEPWLNPTRFHAIIPGSGANYFSQPL